jgi:hypothetical protein
MPKATPGQKKAVNGLLRELIVLRDGESCLRCKKTTALQMSHIYPKGHYRKLEYDEQNLKLLCVGCHLFWWHKSPMEAQQWLTAILPKDRLDYLKLRSQVNDKTPFDFNLIKLYLQQEIAKLKKLCNTSPIAR